MSHHPELSPSEGGAVLAVHVQPVQGVPKWSAATATG